MVDHDKERNVPKAGSGQRAGDPSISGGSSQHMYGAGDDFNDPSGQQTAQGRASQLAGNAKEQAKGLASQAAEQGKSALNQQKDNVAQQVDSVSGAMRSAADQLQHEGQPNTGYYVGMLADQIESFGRQIRGKDANGLIRDVENLSRRNPAAFFVGALAVGFVAARFMKSSAERSSYEYGDDSYGTSRMQRGSQDDMSYSWRNEMGEGERDDNIGRNRTYPLDKEEDSLMADRDAGGTLGGQWGAGTNVAGPEITGIYRPSESGAGSRADSSIGASRPGGSKASATGVELPGSAQPAVSADGKPQPGRPTDAIDGSTKPTSPTDPKSGGKIHGNR